MIAFKASIYSLPSDSSFIDGSLRGDQRQLASCIVVSCVSGTAEGIEGYGYSGKYIL